MNWIPIKDKLPDNMPDFVISVPVLVFTEHGKHEFAIYHSKDKRWIVSGFRNDEQPTVTHWMPLPDNP